MDLIPSKLRAFSSLPIQKLSHTTRAWLSCQLNPEKSTFSSSMHLQDWRGLAEVMGFSAILIDNFLRSRDPLGEVMNCLSEHQPRFLVGSLCSALVTCERYDVLEDPVFEKLLEEHSEETVPSKIPIVRYMQPEPQSGFRSDDSGFLTVCEADTGEQEFFDAYVCYAEADADFVSQMREVLEDKYKLRLCIPDRDLLPGLFMQESLTKLIKERCTKMIAVLSPEYVKSDECRFLTNFSSSLELGVHGRKLVPVVVAECLVPDVLLPLSRIHFTRGVVLDWTWTRLAKSLHSQNASSQSAQKSILMPQHHFSSVLPFHSPCNDSLPKNYLSTNPTPNIKYLDFVSGQFKNYSNDHSPSNDENLSFSSPDVTEDDTKSIQNDNSKRLSSYNDFSKRGFDRKFKKPSTDSIKHRQLSSDFNLQLHPIPSSSHRSNSREAQSEGRCLSDPLKALNTSRKKNTSFIAFFRNTKN